MASRKLFRVFKSDCPRDEITSRCQEIVGNEGGTFADIVWVDTVFKNHEAALDHFIANPSVPFIAAQYGVCVIDESGNIKKKAVDHFWLVKLCFEGNENNWKL